MPHREAETAIVDRVEIARPPVIRRAKTDLALLVQQHGVERVLRQLLEAAGVDPPGLRRQGRRRATAIGVGIDDEVGILHAGIFDARIIELHAQPVERRRQEIEEALIGDLEPLERGSAAVHRPGRDDRARHAIIGDRH